MTTSRRKCEVALGALWVRRILGCSMAFSIAACAHSPARSAETSAHEFAKAAAERNEARVSSRLSERAVESLGVETTTKLLGRYAKEQAELRGELERGDYSLSIEAVYFLPDGRKVVLEGTKENFVLRDVFGLVVPERTPLSTLVELRYALSHLSEGRVLALLAPVRRDALGAYLHALRVGLENLEDASISARGEKVSVRLSTGLLIELERRDGEYFVMELE